ncbi:MAG: HAMP domain-containing histidine kinase [Anaerolineales bacterium]|nr:HAMP domain-containing histidine kinase [Anaerolineales bacterium]
MLRGLHLRLTLLYLLAALLLVILIGGSSYYLLQHYFQSSTDLALQHKMATVFQMYGVSLPPELITAEQAWNASQARLAPFTPAIPVMQKQAGDEGENMGEGAENSYDAELAAIFVLPIGASGELVNNPNPYPLPMAPNLEAGSTALVRGYDWRTTRLVDGTPVRLLTYRLFVPGLPAWVQLGRLLNDQERVLGQLLTGLLTLGAASILLLGAASWWLAGRSLLPAQKAWDQQQTFVANAGHELRTPLTLIRAGVEVAMRNHTGGEQKTLFKDIMQECDHMARLVEDLLLLSRLDAGRLQLEHQLIVLPDFLPEILRQVERLAEKREIHVSLNQAQGKVWGDPTRLRQVLLILLDNALRYTRAGGHIQGATQLQGQMVHIIVTDNGHGIPVEHLPHVFERFYQVENTRTDEPRGNGLGLSIAKALVEAQGGTIRLDSRVGEGTQVILALPGADTQD